jgi:hypothetical protein
MSLSVCGAEKPVRACKEISGSTSCGSAGSWVASRRVGSSTRGTDHILFRNIFENGHKYFLFLTLVPQKIFFITIIAKTLQLAFNHFRPS